MSDSSDVTTTRSRRRIQVRGIVQGVGFRPFVYGLAVKLDLVGFVRNDAAGVTIEVEGPAAAVELFLSALIAEAPPLSYIESVTTDCIPPVNDTTFAIDASQAGAAPNTLISPDVATCDDCLQELLDPTDRRYGYPFINCTNCGPRFTIVQDIPYDRDKTTMAVFPLCPQCRAEYEDPLDRRFHAQPNACPVCGPSLELRFLADDLHVSNEREDKTARKLQASREMKEAARLLIQGKIVAIKGLGGYHLACDALNAAVVSTLRGRKHREAKPFALMVPDLETARRLCFVDQTEAELLLSRQRPIVLLRQLPNCPIAPQVAPGYNTLGLMLPYTPLHTLLFEQLAKDSARLAGDPFVGDRQVDANVSRPAVMENEPQIVALVMTSGNVSDEPIAYRDDDAQQRLAAIADAVLGHNRQIYTRCDDSVMTVVDVRPANSDADASGRRPMMLRRSRGYVPEPVRMQRPFSVPILAVGGHLKNSFCLGKGDRAFLSHHIGDLENLETLQSFAEGIDHFIRLFDIQPELIAHDLHPDYLSTKWALNPPSSVAPARPPVAVQHHHAHIASVLAEHGLDGPVIGVAADGTGYGPDGAVWGGEVMVADLAHYDRIAHLAYVPLPGGEQAIRQPWRMAAVYLQHTFGDDFLDLDIPFVQKLDRRRWRPLAQMIARGLNSPSTSSLGRLFDAVACLLLGRDEVVYEGQAAIELEILAAPAHEPYPFAVEDGPPLEWNVRPAIRTIVQEIEQGAAVSVIAGRFHRTVAAMITDICQRVRVQTGLQSVALSGGVFQNRLLLEQLLPLLATDGFQVYINHQVPPNDGGISLGQATVAAAQLIEK